MKKIIKRVDKSYLGLAVLWLLSVLGEEVTWLTISAGVIMFAYIIYKMWGVNNE
jgi:hypothetical protein